MRQDNVPKIRDWKQQFMEVKTIGPEPKMLPPGAYWKQHKIVEIEPVEVVSGDTDHQR